MRLQTVLLATLSLCTLAACGGGGSTASQVSVTHTDTSSTSLSITSTSSTQRSSENQPTRDDAVVIQEAKTFELPFFLNDSESLYINNQKVEGAYDFSKQPDGLNEMSYSIKNGDSSVKESGKLYIYNQQYSLVQSHVWNEEAGSNNLHKVGDIVGLQTTTLPESGTFTYTGKAFDGTGDQGDLSYTVNFNEKIGSGSITGLSRFGRIALQQGNITSGAVGFHKNSNDKIISGAAKSEILPVLGNYRIGFFGHHAEEIAGFVKFNEHLNEIGFAGKR